MTSPRGPLVALMIFFFNDTATTEIYTLSLHDALPISTQAGFGACIGGPSGLESFPCGHEGGATSHRSEEHTSELQSQSNLVCRLLLEKQQQPRPLRT